MTTAVNYWDLDHQIVYGFLLLTLLYGLYVGRNNKNIADYAIAGKSYGTSTLILTLLATQVGGFSTLGKAQCIFSDGLIMPVVALGYPISYFFLALFVAPRIVKFEGCITMGD
ncbi:MAG: sodium:solute symporter family protein, partial [Bacteroidota bacterium]